MEYGIAALISPLVRRLLSVDSSPSGQKKPTLSTSPDIHRWWWWWGGGYQMLLVELRDEWDTREWTLKLSKRKYHSFKGWATLQKQHQERNLQGKSSMMGIKTLVSATQRPKLLSSCSRRCQVWICCTLFTHQPAFFNKCMHDLQAYRPPHTQIFHRVYCPLLSRVSVVWWWTIWLDHFLDQMVAVWNESLLYVCSQG